MRALWVQQLLWCWRPSDTVPYPIHGYEPWWHAPTKPKKDPHPLNAKQDDKVPIFRAADLPNFSAANIIWSQNFGKGNCHDVFSGGWLVDPKELPKCLIFMKLQIGSAMVAG